MNKNLPYGVDISAYQGQIDFSKLLPKIDFLAARATISWGYSDKWFSRNRQMSESKPFVAYHVLYPGENINSQADNLLRVAPPDKHIRYCIDSELDHGFSKGIITKAIRDISERMKRETGHYPMQYSRASWLNQFVSITDLPVLDWWLAQYLRATDGVTYTPEHQGPPTLPKGVNTWLIHQTGERGNGAEHGVPASANRFIDTNRWNGSKDDILKYFGYKSEPEPDPEPPVIIPEPAKQKAQVYAWATPYVNVRNKPSTSGTVVGKNYPNDIVDVVRNDGEWLALLNGYSMSKYYERISEPVDPEPPVIPDPVEPEPEPTIPDGLLDVPHYSQTDPLWAQDIIGASNFNVGAKGCLLTITAAGLTFFGFQVNPMAYNCLASGRGGYLITTENGKKYANMYWQFPDVLTKGQIIRDEYQTFAGGTGWESAANGILAKGKPVWCEVRLNSYQHWVMILGKVDGAYWILDPIDGVVKVMDYPNVYRTVSYSRKEGA